MHDIQTGPVDDQQNVHGAFFLSWCLVGVCDGGLLGLFCCPFFWFSFLLPFFFCVFVMLLNLRLSVKVCTGSQSRGGGYDNQVLKLDNSVATGTDSGISLKHVTNFLVFKNV